MLNFVINFGLKESTEGLFDQGQRVAVFFIIIIFYLR